MTLRVAHARDPQLRKDDDAHASDYSRSRMFGPRVADAMRGCGSCTELKAAQWHHGDASWGKGGKSGWLSEASQCVGDAAVQNPIEVVRSLPMAVGDGSDTEKSGEDGAHYATRAWHHARNGRVVLPMTAGVAQRRGSGRR